MVGSVLKNAGSQAGGRPVQRQDGDGPPDQHGEEEHQGRRERVHPGAASALADCTQELLPASMWDMCYDLDDGKPMTPDRPSPVSLVKLSDQILQCSTLL